MGHYPRPSLPAYRPLGANSAVADRQAAGDRRAPCAAGAAAGADRQPSVPYALNPLGVLSFGVKIGRRSAEIVLCDFHGHVLERAQRAYAYPAPEPIIAFILGEIARMRGLFAGRRIAGIGVAMPFDLWKWPMRWMRLMARWRAGRSSTRRRGCAARGNRPADLCRERCDGSLRGRARDRAQGPQRRPALSLHRHLRPVAASFSMARCIRAGPAMPAHSAPCR